MRVFCLLRLRVNINNQFSIYQRVFERKAGVFETRKVESFKLVVIVVSVQLFGDKV